MNQFFSNFFKYWKLLWSTFNSNFMSLYRPGVEVCTNIFVNLLNYIEVGIKKNFLRSIYTNDRKLWKYGYVVDGCSLMRQKLEYNWIFLLVEWRSARNTQTNIYRTNEGYRIKPPEIFCISRTYSSYLIHMTSPLWWQSYMLTILSWWIHWPTR